MLMNIKQDNKKFGITLLIITTITDDAEQAVDLAEVIGLKFFLASLRDALVNPITIWIIVILGVLIALYFVGRKFYRKK
jgi:Mn2+/Fe2+ NRAMP family transporter